MENEQSFTSQNSTETKVQPQQVNSSSNKLFVIVTVSVLLTAIVAGLTFYFWQRSAREKTVSSLEQKINSLEEQISAMKNEEITPRPISSPALSPSPAVDPTMNWEKYSDEKLGFSIRYPQDWLIEEPTPPSEEITIVSEEESISLYKLSSSPIVGMPLLDWYKSLTSAETLYDGATEILERKEVALASVKGIQLKVRFNTQTIVIYLPRPNSVFRIIIDPAGVIESPKVDQILSTFKFTD